MEANGNDNTTEQLPNNNPAIKSVLCGVFECLGEFFCESCSLNLRPIARPIRLARRDHGASHLHSTPPPPIVNLSPNRGTGPDPTSTKVEKEKSDVDNGQRSGNGSEPNSLVEQKQRFLEVRFRPIITDNNRNGNHDPGFITDLSGFATRIVGEWGIVPEVYSAEISFAGRDKESVQVKYLNLPGHESHVYEEVVGRLKTEAVEWLKASSPHVVKFYGLYQDTRRDRIVVISESLPGVDGTFQSRHGDINLSPNKKLAIVKGVSRGVADLHSHNIVHGNLRRGNIIVGPGEFVKITSFGYPCVFPRTSAAYIETQLESLKWCAPEILSGNSTDCGQWPQLSKESDMWALGITVLEIMDGLGSLWGASATGVKIEPSARILAIDILNGAKPNKEHYPLSRKSVSLWDVLSSCWATEPDKRCNAKDFLRDIEAVEDIDDK